MVLLLGGLGSAAAWRFLRASPAERAEHFRGLGAARLQEEAFADAEPFLRSALVEDAVSVPTHLLLARSLFGQERDDEAVATLRAALVLDPEHGEVACRLATWHLGREGFSEAEELATRATRSPAHTAQAHRLRAAARLGQGRPHAALEDLRVVVRERPEGAGVCLAAADLAALLGEATWDRTLAAEAEALLERAERRATAGGADDLVRAAILLRRGLHGSARVALEGAPGGVARTLLEAEILAAQGAAGEAEQRLRAALETAPSERLHVALVSLLTQAGRIETAVSALGDAERAHPDDGELSLAARRLAEARQRGRHPERLLPALLARPGGRPNPFELPLRAALAERADDAEAVRVRVGLNAPELLGLPADTAGRAEQLAALDQDLGRLLEEDASDAVALTWQAALALFAGRAPEAIPLCDRAVESRPGLRPALLVRAVAHLATAQLADAEADARAAQALAPGAPAVAALLTRILHAGGNHAAALTVGQRALASTPSDLTLAAAVKAVLEDPERPENETRPGDTSQATLLDARLKLARGDVAAAGDLARTLLDQDQPQAARRVLGEAWDAVAARLREEQRAQPDDPEIPLKRAQALVHAGRVPQAGSVLEEALERHPEHSDAALALSRLRASEGRREEALAHIAAVVERAPDRGEAHLERALVLAAGGRTREATDALLALLGSAVSTRYQFQAAVWALAMGADTPAVLARVDPWLTAREAAGGEERETAILRGHVLVVQQDLEAAAQLTTDLVARHPEDAAVRFLEAVVAASRDELAHGERLSALVLNAAPGHVPARRLLAAIRVERGRRAHVAGNVSAARRLWSDALGLADSDVGIALLLGRSFAADDDAVAARAVYRRLNAAHPESPVAPLVLAFRAQTRGEPAAALPNYREAHARSPREPASLIGLTETMAALGDREGALLVAQKAVNRGDAQGVAHYALGRVLVLLDRTAEAETAFRESVARHRGNWEALAGLVDLLAAAGRHEEARAVIAANRAAAAVPRGWGRSLARMLERAKDQDAALAQLRGEVQASGGYAARIELGLVLARAGDLEAAKAEFEAAIRVRPGAQDAYFHLVQVYYQLGQVDEAVERFSAAIERREDLAASRCVLALIAEQRKDFAQAEQLYRAALEVRPDLAIAANNLAWLIGVHGGRPTEALDLARKARTAAPGSAEFADTLGWLLHLSGESLTGLAELDHAVRLAPARAGFHHHRGEVLGALSRPEPAIEAFERAVSLDPGYADKHQLTDRIAELRAVLDARGK